MRLRAKPNLEGSTLNAEGLSQRQEEKLLKSAKELFLNEFPNPERKGCPDSDTIKAMASGKLIGEKARSWWPHFAACSPCARELVAFQKQAKGWKTIQFAAIAATILIAVAIGVWLIVHGGLLGPEEGSETIARQSPVSYQPAVLDLRSRSLVRGGSTSNDPPLELPRHRVFLSIYLPTGTEPADFDVEIAQQADQPILTTSGSANLRDHITVLEAKLDLTALPPGAYLLALRQKGWDWNYYRLALK